MQNKIRWIKDCLLRRRAGKPEVGYGEFLESQTWFDRFRNGRKDFAALAGVAPLNVENERQALLALSR